MTSILKLGLNMVKIYLHTKNEVSMSRGSKGIALTDRNTDRQTDTQTHRYTDTQADRHDQKHYLPAYTGDKDKTICQRYKSPTRIYAVLSVKAFLSPQLMVRTGMWTGAHSETGQGAERDCTHRATTSQRSASRER